jgi:hypothetical protein
MTKFLYFLSVPGTNYTFVLAIAPGSVPVDIVIFSMQ